ncbi:glutathione S-transferase family protein [Turneriella parva]|uniref:Glutathione S-transferase domain-containing protein n=1 Tax=Turneriella parva (strain ATCC BAA-1111 / DSM 21527 / NCTC 11395 / H) TaxID=869212 RepID=I4B578_TURPD|nr:glutathione S-transferase [Turneriella parva]AFM12435.1 Glutathione S-transferase domain-containing protein [Turneriella parva DSM 21527]
MRLISISISHYVEKVKWALQLAGLPFTEESYIPGLHAAVTLWHTGGRHRATPVLIDDGEVIPDSTAILQHLAARYRQTWLYAHPEALVLEERFDASIGPHTRRFIYRHLFDNELSLAEIFSQDVVPAWQKRMLPLAAPMLKAGMIAEMAIYHDEAERSRLVFEAEFAYVDKLLQDGRPFLCGEKISAADITFAALAAPVILPSEYGARLPDLNSVKPGSTLPAVIEGYRNTTAGKYVQRLYRENRR